MDDALLPTAGGSPLTTQWIWLKTNSVIKERGKRFALPGTLNKTFFLGMAHSATLLLMLSHSVGIVYAPCKIVFKTSSYWTVQWFTCNQRSTIQNKLQHTRIYIYIYVSECPTRRIYNLILSDSLCLSM